MSESARVLIPSLTAPPRIPRDAAPFALQGATMGTTWSVRGFAAYGFDTAPLTGAIDARLNAIIAQMSPWEAHSELSRFNALEAGAVIAVSADFEAVLDCALEIAAESDGAFDPTLGALVDLWGFGALPAADERPDPEALLRALARAGWRKLERDGARVRQPGGLHLDLNGVAKGFAVDALAALVADAGASSYLVEIGGELRGVGVKPDGQPWWVAIECPPESDIAPTLAALHEVSIATSGDYRRAAVLDGRTIAHTLDPRTGEPLRNGVASVTVLHPSCMRADAYATALMVLGAEAGLALAARLGLAAHIVERMAGAREHFSPAALEMLA